MINKEIIKTLKIIYETLKGRDIKWVLVGSCSLALQGVNINPQDVDSITNRTDAYKMNRLFKRYEISPVKYKSSVDFRSYFGKFDINGVRFEVMGDIEERFGEQWVSLSHRLINPRIVNFRGMLLPVSFLSDHLESYSKSNREKDKEKTEKIRRVLNSHSA